MRPAAPNAARSWSATAAATSASTAAARAAVADQRSSNTMNVEEAAAAILAVAGPIRDPQTDLPRIARNAKVWPILEETIRRVDTTHRLLLSDARDMSE